MVSKKRPAKDIDPNDILGRRRGPVLSRGKIKLIQLALNAEEATAVAVIMRDHQDSISGAIRRAILGFK